jgi:hypothetical protein
MDSDQIELRYETPPKTPSQITFQNFPDGGVTITIPFTKKGNLLGLILGLLIAQYILVSPVFYWGITQHLWSTIAFFAIVPMFLPGLILFALLFAPKGKADFVEVIAVSPDLVYIQLTNTKSHSFPRADFKSLEIRQPFYTPHWTTPRRIDLAFHHYGIQQACFDRTVAETEKVAAALQKAFDATAPMPPKSSLAPSP